MNKTMAAMNESLLGKGANCSGERKDPKMAESAKRKHESMNSDLEELLGDCSKKHKLDESDPLLDEIAKLMHGEEKTDRAIADSLAKIIQSRWLNKLNEEQRKNVCGKYLKPSNCNKLINPRGNPEIWK